MMQSLLQRPKVCSFAPIGLAIVLTLPGSLLAQRSRIPGKINSRQWTPLSGNVHPNARTEYDQGKTSDTLPLPSVTLVLKPSATQQTDLEQLLADQQNPTSPNYHKWITPSQFGDRFGASQSDIDKIVEWAQSAQLTVARVATARNGVTLQGSAAQFGSALRRLACSVLE